jgi:hypothetical protein
MKRKPGCHRRTGHHQHMLHGVPSKPWPSKSGPSKPGPWEGNCWRIPTISGCSSQFVSNIIERVYLFSPPQTKGLPCPHCPCIHACPRNTMCGYSVSGSYCLLRKVNRRGMTMHACVEHLSDVKCQGSATELREKKASPRHRPLHCKRGSGVWSPKKVLIFTLPYVSFRAFCHDKFDSFCVFCKHYRYNSRYHFSAVPIGHYQNLYGLV